MDADLRVCAAAAAQCGARGRALDACAAGGALRAADAARVLDDAAAHLLEEPVGVAVAFRPFLVDLALRAADSVARGAARAAQLEAALASVLGALEHVYLSLIHI